MLACCLLAAVPLGLAALLRTTGVPERPPQ
jgi:hypothetical protein